jgi:N-alpha-acetyltransferase 15/16, NatA auxiliary subunit
VLVSQHYDTMGDRVRALELAEEAIAHTPTVPDLYLFKGRVLKHLGRLWEASDAADYARKLDLSDRYLNSSVACLVVPVLTHTVTLGETFFCRKSTKYKLRAGRIEEAKATISLFARDSADAMANVRDVQTVWFELECAHAYARAGNLGMVPHALRCLTVVGSAIANPRVFGNDPRR